MISKKQCVHRVNYLQGKSNLLHAFTMRAINRRHMLRKIRKHLVLILRNLLLDRQFHEIKIKNFYRRRKKYSKFLADYRKLLRVQYRKLEACYNEESRLNRKLLELRKNLERGGLIKTFLRKYSLNTEKVQKEHRKGKVKLPDDPDNNINSLVHFVKTGEGLERKLKLNKPMKKVLKKIMEWTVGNRTGKSGYRHSKSRLLEQSLNKEINNLVNLIPPTKKNKMLHKNVKPKAKKILSNGKKETSKSKSKSLVAKQTKSLKLSKHNVEKIRSKSTLSPVDKSVAYQNKELRNPSRTSPATTNSVHSRKKKKLQNSEVNLPAKVGSAVRFFDKESSTDIGRMRRRSQKTTKARRDTMLSNSYDSISSAMFHDSVPSRSQVSLKHSRKGRITSIKGDEIVVIDGKRHVPASDVENEYRDTRKYLDGEMKKTVKKRNVNYESESDEEKYVPKIKPRIEKVESQTTEKKEKKNPVQKMGSIPSLDSKTSSKRKLTLESKTIVDIPQIIAARTRQRELFLEQLNKNAVEDKLFYERCKRLLMLVKANVVPTQPEDLELLYDYGSNRDKYISTLESILLKLKDYGDFPIHNIHVLERFYKNLMSEVFRDRRVMLNLYSKDVSRMPSTLSNLDASSYKVMDFELKDIEDIKAKWTQYFKEQEKTPMQLQLEASRKKQKLEKLTAIKQAKCQRLSEKRNKALQMRPITALYTDPRLTQRMRKVLEHIKIEKEPTTEIKELNQIDKQQSKILNTWHPEDLCMKEKPLEVETETALQRFIRIYGQHPVVCI